jgi:hypothetical protein
MLLKEIKQSLMGKTISHYDGWNGSHDYFKIGHIQNDGSCVRVFPEKGKGWGVFIPKNIIPVLLQHGNYTKHNEVERCSYEENWSLL